MGPTDWSTAAFLLELRWERHVGHSPPIERAAADPDVPLPQIPSRSTFLATSDRWRLKRKVESLSLATKGGEWRRKLWWRSQSPPSSPPSLLWISRQLFGGQTVPALSSAIRVPALRAIDGRYRSISLLTRIRSTYRERGIM